ncbi:MAG: hypothetical protein ACYTHM_19860 [Planctomycetota bacterium]|jgi:hypothetical protein
MDDSIADILASRLEGVPREFIERLAAWFEELGGKLGEEGFSAHELAAAMTEGDLALPASPSGEGSLLGEADLRAVADLFGTAGEGAGKIPAAPTAPKIPGLEAQEAAAPELDTEALKALTGNDFVPPDAEDRREIQEALDTIKELDGITEEALKQMKAAFATLPEPAPEELPGVLDECLEEKEPAPSPPDPGPESTPEQALADMEALMAEMEKGLDEEIAKLKAEFPDGPELIVPTSSSTSPPEAPKAGPPGDPGLETPKVPGEEGKSELEELVELFDEVKGKLAEQLDALDIDKDEILKKLSF